MFDGLRKSQSRLEATVRAQNRAIAQLRDLIDSPRSYDDSQETRGARIYRKARKLGRDPVGFFRDAKLLGSKKRIQGHRSHWYPGPEST